MSDDVTKPLAGKVAVVTGGVRRIGRAIALGLAQDGAAVIVHARNSTAEAAAVAEEIGGLGVAAMVCLADVTDETAIRRMANEIGERFGRLDILVNNAAIRGQVPFLEMTLAQWRAVTSI